LTQLLIKNNNKQLAQLSELVDMSSRTIYRNFIIKNKKLHRISKPHMITYSKFKN